MIRPSGTSSDAVFDAVADNPYFVGEIGPGAKKEYEAGAGMARAMAGEGKSYLLLSIGASSGNKMHRLRTLGMLEVLQEVHGVTFPRSCEELAVVAEATAVEAGGVRVMICPGYLVNADNSAAASEIISTGEYTTVLSAVPVAPLMDALRRISWQNVCFALAIKFIVMIMGLFGYANMWIAVFADTGVSMLCLLNSVRILHMK